MGKFHNEDYLNYLEKYVSKEISSKFTSFGIDRFSFPQNESICLEYLEKRQTYKVG
jgi:hypothetical protein